MSHLNITRFWQRVTLIVTCFGQSLWIENLQCHITHSVKYSIIIVRSTIFIINTSNNTCTLNWSRIEPSRLFAAMVVANSHFVYNVPLFSPILTAVAMWYCFLLYMMRPRIEPCGIPGTRKFTIELRLHIKTPVTAWLCNVNTKMTKPWIAKSWWKWPCFIIFFLLWYSLQKRMFLSIVSQILHWWKFACQFARIS